MKRTIPPAASAAAALLALSVSTAAAAEISCSTAEGCGVVGDFVWHDLDGDGLQDANEPGVGGVTVGLYAVANPSSPLATTTTLLNGLYSFSNVPDQNGGIFYFIEFSDLPVGFSFTIQDVGADDALDSDADPLTGRTASFNHSFSTDPTWELLTLDAGLVRGAAVPAPGGLALLGLGAAVLLGARRRKNPAG